MATKVGLLHLDVMIGDAMTRKDKRRIVKSFKDRMRHNRNVSIAEVDYVESIRRSVLAVAMVGNDGRLLESSLRQVVNAARDHRGWVLLDYQLDVS